MLKKDSVSDIANDKLQPKSFLEKAFERVLFNRLGVEHRYMDELME